MIYDLGISLPLSSSMLYPTQENVKKWIIELYTISHRMRSQKRIYNSASWTSVCTIGKTEAGKRELDQTVSDQLSQEMQVSCLLVPATKISQIKNTVILVHVPCGHDLHIKSGRQQDEIYIQMCNHSHLSTAQQRSVLWLSYAFSVHMRSSLKSGYRAKSGEELTPQHWFPGIALQPFIFLVLTRNRSGLIGSFFNACPQGRRPFNTILLRKFCS